ncbi:hypothetical protein OIU34_38655 [Pararhizobium sp. BT-229]|uniref:hypothetical protein n=1 Tax=Pararhizobium sp. BT-229 TaxID=2986923 RepID=UPI0021F7B3BF|nr:hypothetical protein [Pararhizobium sp. BT-229]MCV9967743.1 hypothetical protein [Pararhizobium sp. BT-229]
MTIEPIGIFLALAGIYTMAAGLSVGVYFLCMCTLLGAAAALILPSLSGANIQPSHFALVFLTAAVALRPKTLAASLSCLSYPGPGFWFTLFTLYSVLTALFLPRIFAGATIVYSLARNNEMHRILSTPLSPSTSNLTQAIYMLGSFCCFAIVAGFGRLGGMAIVARALIATSAVCIFFAVADVATYSTNSSDLLSIIRNANYRMLNDGDIEGFKRIVGSFPEAGAFGYTALALFTFVLMLGLEGFPARFLGAIASALAVALVLCTSTTAYAASAITTLIVLIFCIARILRNNATSRHLVYVAVCLFALPLLVMTVMLIPAMWESISNLVHATVTTKLESQSGEERMRWNAQALNSLLETNGMGAGVGSIRASSFVVALLANVGILGTIIFFLFLLSLVRSVLRRNAGSGVEQTVGFAAMLASIAQVTAASISAGAIDLGPLFAITAGLAAAYALGPLPGQTQATDKDSLLFALPQPRGSFRPNVAINGLSNLRREAFASGNGVYRHE